MSLELIKEAKFTRVSDGATAAQTAVNSASVDMTGFNGLTFVVELGTVDALGTGTAVIAYSDDDATFTDLENPITVAWGASDDEGILLLTVAKPTHRYYRCELARATADSVIDSILAIQTDPIRKPTTQSSDVIDSSLVVGG